MFGRNVGVSDYAGSLLKDFEGSTIDLKDFDVTGLHETFSASSGLLQLTNSASQTATLDFQTSSLSAGTFHFASDGGSGVLITQSQREIGFVASSRLPPTRTHALLSRGLVLGIGRPAWRRPRTLAGHTGGSKQNVGGPASQARTRRPERCLHLNRM